MQLLNRERYKSRAKTGEPEILIFGTGNFLRAFAGPIIQVLREKTDFSGYSIMVKNTLSESPAYQQLLRQDGLYHVLTRGIENGEAVNYHQLISHVRKVIHPWLEPHAFEQLASIPNLKYIISNTTEAGIVYDTNALLNNFPSANFPARVTQLLYRRYQRFAGAMDKGWIFLPCELIEDNGALLRAYVLRYAASWGLEPAFSDWVNRANVFCNSLVDRIVPGFPAAGAEAIQAQIGYKDDLLVSAEPYLLWAIETPAVVRAQLPLDQLGFNIHFTDNIADYRTKKVSILNGAHTSMVPIGLLHGIKTVREAIEDEYTGQLLRRIIFEEILSTLDYPAADLQAYANAVIDRFRNPFIDHKLYDISLNSISKFRVRVLPTFLSFYEKTGRWPEGLALAFAALIRYYKGDVHPVRDEGTHTEFFRSAWQSFEGHRSEDQLIEEILSSQAAWGLDLTTKSELKATLKDALFKNYLP